MSSIVVHVFIFSLVFLEVFSQTRRDVAKVAPKISRTMDFVKSEVEEGSEASVTCLIINGDVPVTLSWLKDGKPLPIGRDVTIRNPNEYTSQLTILKTNVLHSGSYTCVAKNSAGVDQKSVTLKVIPKQPSVRPTPAPPKLSRGGSGDDRTVTEGISQVDQERLNLEKERWEMEKKVFQLQMQKLQLEVDCMTKNRNFCLKAN